MKTETQLTLHQCKDDVAQRLGYASFEDFDDKLTWATTKEVENVLEFIDLVAILYAKQQQAGAISVENTTS